jgi:hypothetical protein
VTGASVATHGSFARVTIQLSHAFSDTQRLTSARLFERQQHPFALLSHRRDVAPDAAEPARPFPVRKQPETFCCSFTIRRSRSARLLSKGAAGSLRKRNTSCFLLASRRSRLRACLHANCGMSGGGCASCPSATSPGSGTQSFFEEPKHNCRATQVCLVGLEAARHRRTSQKASREETTYSRQEWHEDGAQVAFLRRLVALLNRHEPYIFINVRRVHDGEIFTSRKEIKPGLRRRVRRPHVAANKELPARLPLTPSERRRECCIMTAHGVGRGVRVAG